MLEVVPPCEAVVISNSPWHPLQRRLQLDKVTTSKDEEAQQATTETLRETLRATGETSLPLDQDHNKINKAQWAISKTNKATSSPVTAIVLL